MDKEMQKVQADTERRALLERRTYRERRNQVTHPKRQERGGQEKDRGTHMERQADKSEAGGQGKEKPGPQKASGHSKMKQKVVCGVRLDAGLGETVA